MNTRSSLLRSTRALLNALVARSRLLVVLTPVLLGTLYAGTAVQFTAPGTVRTNFTGTVGFTFTPSSSITVTHVGFWDNGDDGLAVSHQVGIWQNTGLTLLASESVPSGTTAPLTGGFRYVELSSPLVLSAGVLYRIGASVESSDGFCQDPTGFTSDSKVGYANSAYETAPFGFPGSNANPTIGFFGVNFVFVASPTVTGITPNSGSTVGGTSVTISGTELTGATAVKFGGTDAQAFTVDSATQITATTPAHGVGAVSVQVTTPGGTNAANTLFTYVNFAPTDIALSSSSIAENNALGATVGMLSATDADAGQTHTFSLVTGTGDTDNSSFDITGSTLTLNGSANYESKNSYSIRVQANDGNGGTFQKQFTVTVTDLNEAPVITSNGGGAADSVTVAENTTAVTTVVATDPEVPATQTLTYSKSGTDAAFFTINSSTGVLSFTSAPNYESPSDAGNNNVYNVTVTATDNGTGTLSDSQDLAVTVTNVNEAPSFAKGADQLLPSNTNSLQTVTNWATAIDDGDSTVTQGLTFNVSNNNAGLFTTAPSISSSGTLTYTPSGTAGTATVTVSLTDDNTINGNPALTTADQTFTITVEVVADYTVSTAGNAVVITDNSGNADTLSISEPSAGNINFAATGRTFSVNGGLNLTGASGSLALAGVTSITVNAGAGADAISVGAFTGTLPSLTLNGGIGDDTVNFNGDITFASGASLDVDLQNDNVTPGTDAVIVAANANVITAGSGTVAVKVSKNIALASGSSFETVDGGITLEANQQGTPTSGGFVGVDVSNGLVRSTGTGVVSVLGKGGSTGNDQIGVRVHAGGDIIGGTSGTLTVIGAGGASTGTGNAGVNVNGSGSTITALGAHVQVTGTGGGGTYSMGLDLYSSPQITSTGAGNLTITGNGGLNPAAGAFNHGIIMSATTFASTGGNISVTGNGGSGSNASGDFTGIQMDDSTITSSGSGSVTVNATAGTAATSQTTIGLDIRFTSQITSSGGDVSVTGTGGNTSGSSTGAGAGVRLIGNGTITAGGTGSVSVTGAGVGGSAAGHEGIVINGSGLNSNLARIGAANGATTLTATSGNSASHALVVGSSNAGRITTGNNNPIIINADSINFAGSAIVSSGTAPTTINTRTAGTLINLGGADVLSGSPLTLGLTDAELDTITASTLIIGSASSGNVTVSAAISPASYATLDIQKGVTFSATGGFASDVTSMAVFEKMKANGAVVINTSATLTATALGGYVPTQSDSFTILDNISASTTTGNFSGKSEGTLVAIGGTNRAITYTGGTGNDVVFTSLAPTLTTPTSTALAALTATLGGNVTSDGGADVTARGVVYSVTTTNGDPQIGGTGVTTVTGTGTTGVFTVDVSSLSASTGYTYAAYATNAAGTSYSATGTFTTTGDFAPTPGVPVHYSDVIGGSGPVKITGGGELVLSGANTYTGNTLVQNGKVSINSVAPGSAPQPLGRSTDVHLGVAGASSGTLVYTGGAGTLDKHISALGNGSDTIQNSGSGLLTLSGTLTKTGTTLTLKGGASGIRVTGAITGNTGSRNSDLVIDGGTTTLASANTYNGPTYIINGGTLNADAVDALPTSPARSDILMDQTGTGGSTLALGVSQSVFSLTGAATSSLNLNANSLTVGDASGSSTFAGVISGVGGSLIKDGASELTLTGANTYTGGTTVSAGTIVLGNQDGFGTGTVTLADGVTFRTANFEGNSAAGALPNDFVLSGGTVNVDVSFATGKDIWINTSVSGTGGLSVSGSGRDPGLMLSGAKTFSGGVTIGSDSRVTIDHNSSLGTGGLQISGGTGTLRVAGNVSGVANDISVASGAILGAVVDSGLTGVLSGVISGSGGGLTKSGDGTLALSGANTYTGDTTISAGTLQINNGGSLSTSSAIINNATLTFNRSTDITQGTHFASVISGTGAVRKSGSGILVLTGANTYTGSTIISGGTLQIGNGGTTGSLSTSSAITNNATLVFNRSDTITQGADFNSVIGGSGGTVTQSGSGTLVFNGNNTYTGATTVSTGVLNIRHANALGTTAAGTSVTSGAALQIQGGITTGAEALTLNGTGVSTTGALRNISGNNDFAGLVTLGSATRINSDSSGETLTLSNTGTITGTFGLTVGGAGNTTIASIIGTDSGTLTKDGAGTLTLTAANTYTGTTTISAGTLALSGSGRLSNSSAVSVSGGTFDIGSVSDTVGAVTLGSGSITGSTGVLTGSSYAVASGSVSAILGGSGVALTKTTASTVTLSGVNTYTGATTISAGTLALSGAGALSDSTAVNLTGATGVFDISGITASGETVGSLAGVASSSVVITGKTLTAGGTNANTTFAGVISGVGGALTKAGAGELTLSGANTYSGNTTIDGGAIFINHATAIGSGALVAGATARIDNTSGSAITLSNNNNVTLSGGSLTFTGSNNLSFGSGVLTISGNNRTITTDGGVLTFGGIDAAGSSPTTRSLTKSGTGTLVITGAAGANFQGGFIHDDGTLILGNKASLGTGALTMQGGILQASTDLDGANALTVSGWSLAASSNFSGNSSITLGNSTVGMGASRSIFNDITAGKALTLGAFAISSDSTSQTLTISGSGATTVNGVISNGGTSTGSALTKNGTGVLTLTAANTYAGATTITAGTLALSGAGALSDSSAVNLNGATAVFDISGITAASESVGSLAGVVSSSAVLGAKTLTAGGNDGTTSFAGVISGTDGSLTKAGTGTLTLSVTNTFTGTTTVSAGTLSITGSINNSATIAVNGGLLSTNGANKLADTAAVTVSGGTLTVGGADTVGTLTTSGSGSTIGGSATLTALTYALGGTGTTVTGNLGAGTINSSGTVALNGTAAAATVNVTAGALTLGASSAINSATVVAISGGSLTLGASNQIGDAAVTVSSTGTLALGTNSDTVASVSLTGTGSITGSTGVLTSTAAYDMQAGSVSAILGGTAGLNKTTTGTVTLSGANTYTGTTQISAGTLALSGSGALSNSSSVIVTGGTFDIGSVSDTVAGVQLASGSITGTSGVLTSSSTYDVRSGDVSAILGGTVGLTKTTTGTVTLTGANNYTGLSAVSAGILNIRHATALGTTAGGTSVSNGATLQLQGGITVGAEALTLNGGAASGETGALVNVSGTNTYGGAITVAASSSISAATGSELNLTGGVVKNGTTATFNGGGTINVGTVGISGASANSDLIIDGVTVNLNVANTYNGPTIIRNSGTLKANVVNALPTANGRTAVTFDGSGTSVLTLGAAQSVASLTSAGVATITLDTNTLTVGTSAGSTTFAGTIGGTGGLTKDGASTLVLSGSNTYTGLTDVQAGTLSFGASDVIADTASVRVSGGALAVSTFSDTVAGVQLTSGSITGSSGVLTSTSAYDMQAGSVSAILSGAVGLTKTTTGTVTLTGANLYTGLTTVSAGILNIQNASALGTVAAGTSVASGAALELQGGITTLAEALTLNGTGVSNGGALRNIGGNNDFAGLVTLGGAARVNSDAGTLTLSNTGAITGSGLGLTVGGAGNTTINSIIGTGTGSLTKDGSGTLTLTGANTFTGATAINAGTLQVSGSLAAGSNVAVATGGTLTGAGTVNGNATLTGNGVINLTNPGVISGTLGVTGGNWNGAGSVTGVVTSSSGTFNIGSGANLTATSGLNVTGGTIASGSGTSTITGSVNYTSASSSTFNGVIAGSGKTVTMNNGSGSLTLGGSNTYTGLTDVQAGTLAFGASNVIADTASVKVSGGTLAIGTRSDTVAGVQLTAGSITGSSGVLTSTSTYDVQAGSISAILGGTVGLTKTTAGTVILSGTNTYTGATLLSAGSLVVNGSIGSSSLTTIESGATLLGTGTVGAIQLNSGGAINAGGVSSAGTLNTGSIAIVDGQLVFNLGGTGSYDSLNTTGTIDLTAGGTGAQLVLNAISAYTATLNNAFTLVTNDFADSISGAFAKGTFGGTKVITLSGVDYVENVLGSNYYGRINYAGSSATPANLSASGNDLVLKVVTPEITITESGNNQTDGGTYNFGDVDKVVPAVPLTKTFTIKNDGEVDLLDIYVNDPTGAHAGDYSVNRTGTATFLPPGASTTFTVTFDPSRIGTRTAAITIDSTDLDENPFNLALTGVGSIARDLSEPWTVLYGGVDAPATRRDGVAMAVAIQRSTTRDEALAVFATGYTTNANGDRDIYTAKYDPVTGAKLWDQIFAGAAGGADEAAAIAVDANGDVVITGFTTVGTSNTDVYIAKYSGVNGVALWEDTYAGSGGSFDEGNSIAVHSSGRVLVTGYGRTSTTGADMYVAGYSPAGGLLFERLIDGGSNGDDVARSIAVDSAGDAAIAGYARGSGKDFRIYKVNGFTGATSWQWNVNGSTNTDDEAFSVAFDSTGQVAATGTVRSTNYDLYTVKLTAAGGLVWQKQWNSSFNSSDAGYDIAVDSSGNVIVGGTSYRAASIMDGYVVKYAAANGALVWDRRFNGSVSNQDVINSVDLDGLDNVIATGFSFNAIPNSDVLTAKMFASDGGLVWEKRYNSAASGWDNGVSVAVSTDGNVFVGGYAGSSSGTSDFLVKNYQALVPPVQNAQTIAFANPGGPRVAGSDLPLSASASSGLAVRFSVVSGPATLNDGNNTLSFTGTGPVTIRASQQGNSTWAKATPVDQSFTVIKSSQTIDFALPSTVPYTTSTVVLSGAATSNLAVTYAIVSGPGTITGDVLSFTGSGVVTVSANQAGDARFNAATEVQRSINASNTAPVIIPAGVQQGWLLSYAGSGAGEGRAVALEVSGSSAVASFVAGYTTVGGNKDIYLMKFNNDGTAAWGAPTIVPGSGGGDDEAVAVAVDASGNVYISGYVTMGSGNTDVYVAKFNGGTGANVWTRTFAGSAGGADAAVGLALDGASNVIVGGYTRSIAGTGNDFFAAKLSQAAGTTVWTATHNSSGAVSDVPNAVAVGGSGDVALAGIAGSDAWTLLLHSSTGGIKWQRRYDAQSKPDAVRGVVVDANNDVIITAYSQAANYNIYTAKYSRVDGDIIWEQTYNSSFNSSDAPWAAVLDSNGDIIVAGTSYSAASTPDSITLKYNGASGSLVWQQRYNGPASKADEHFAVAVDANDNPVVTGYSLNSDNTSDIYTAKLASGTGMPMWETRFNGAANKSDYGRAVAADPTGRAWVAGYQTNASNIKELLHVKYQPVGAPPPPLPFLADEDSAMTAPPPPPGLQMFMEVEQGDAAQFSAGYFDAEGNNTVGFSAVLDGLPAGVVESDASAGAFEWEHDTSTLAPGPHELVITATDSAGASASVNVQINVTSNLADRAWRFAHFGTTAAGGIADFGADPDGDGLDNLGEFAFGLNPLQAADARQTSRVSVADAEGGLRAIFRRRKDYSSAGLTYVTQFSSDLSNWFNSTAIPQVLADDGTIEEVSLTFPVLPNGQQGRFFRVVVDSESSPAQ